MQLRVCGVKIALHCHMETSAEPGRGSFLFSSAGDNFCEKMSSHVYQGGLEENIRPAEAEDEKLGDAAAGEWV